eukprot:TRINITY_DN3402_c0_g1_i4.p1 TRINITY_DN3402_c0_g1~~TRINITY_DN3402_c0_g1_i4.p1  ORF type:complete len:153 (-),score=31.08 TRINITY_DN3402_c0_g1_i4:87-545(-)
MRLLALSKLGHFHAAVETIPLADHKDLYIQFPMQLESYLMEGNYNKAFKSVAAAPAEEYNFYLDKLLQTVREEIATCLEVSYETLTDIQLQKLLQLKTSADVAAFAERRKWASKGAGSFHFNLEKKTTSEPTAPLTTITRSLNYAKELEQIV